MNSLSPEHVYLVSCVCPCVFQFVQRLATATDHGDLMTSTVDTNVRPSLSQEVPSSPYQYMRVPEKLSILSVLFLVRWSFYYLW